jgi:hypothetical protein
MARGITSSTEIKKLLKQKFGDTIKFSVTQSVFSGGSSITVSIISGSIPAYTAGQDPKYGTEFSTWSYAEDNELYTPEFKKVIKEVIKITESVYMPNRHSQFVHYRTGSYNAPYQYIPKKSSGKSTTTGGFFGELVTECAGWQIFLKNLGDGRSVYNIVKKKETKPNKGDWNQIRGEIYTEGGFKWSPKTQTFQKWGGDLSKEKIDKVCEILRKYYVDDTPSTPEQQTPSSDLPEADVKLLERLKEDLKDYSDKVIAKIGVKSNLEIYGEHNQSNQNIYVDSMITMIDSMLAGRYSEITKYKVKDVQKYVFEELEEENYYLLNNFLGLYGLYGDSVRLDYVKLSNNFPDATLAPFDTKNKASRETREKTKDDIVKAIKGLKFLADNGNEKAKKAIKGLEILLKNA